MGCVEANFQLYHTPQYFVKRKNAQRSSAFYPGSCAILLLEILKKFYYNKGTKVKERKVTRMIVFYLYNEQGVRSGSTDDEIEAQVWCDLNNGWYSAKRVELPN